MARWMIQLVAPLQPVFNLMKDIIIDYNIASIDATTLQVLNEPGRPPQRKSYLYCLRGGPPDTPVILYSYNAFKHKQFVDEWLEGFSGCVHMDADFFFTALLADPNVLPSYCNAHSRRHFEQIKKLAKKSGLAHEALRYYKKLYKLERYAKENNMTPEQRYQYRQEKAKPIMAEFYCWLKEHKPLVLPESSLGKALSYAIKYEVGLCRYLENGYLEIDNNHTEREIKPVVIARKNFMFAYSVAGAHAICMHMSLIRSAIANRLDPYQYYHALLKKIPHCQKISDYEALLPWNINLA
jgi:transposase